MPVTYRYGVLGVQQQPQWSGIPTRLSSLTTTFSLTLAMATEVVGYPAGGVLWQPPPGPTNNCSLQVQVISQVGGRAGG